ncbi:protein kinase [Acidobacteriota bacterium]
MTIEYSKCHTGNPDDSKFCKECATSLKDIPEVSVSQTKTLLSPAVSEGKLFAGKYKILDEIGRGGMGIVYKAKDTKLKRYVALKFLPAELIQDKKAKARFLQEAQAAAALNHPNICIIHEVDDSDDQTFIAMEYIEGKTLKDRIDSGPLEIDEAVKITAQVAEGLAEAHAKGIVHRDIKPANIMLTEKGTAKIMDFGIAKLAAGVDLTQPSTLIGTVAYMSPEQARGDEVDQRTDIWSLGAMFYEMLTGDRPFQKSQEQALIYAILHDSPTPVSLLRSDIPIHIEKTVEKSLAKKLKERYQNIGEIIRDLKESQSVALPKAEKSIVVLPFENLSPDPDQEYFCDGMTEEITSDLSKIKDLLVISRNSAMTFKGTKKKTKAIGKELNVQYVLEGSVRKAGNNIRITAQLIDSEKDMHIWSEKYNGMIDDVFKIQEKVSRTIVEALKVKLSPAESCIISEKPIDNIKAYEFYLKANQEIFKITEENTRNAEEYLKKGLDLIGPNALLYAGMGFVHYSFFNLTKIMEHALKAEEYAKKAFELDPVSPKAHVLMGCLHFEAFGTPQEGTHHFKKAVDIDPNDSEALIWLAIVLSLLLGQTNSARPYMERALKLNPLDPFTACVPAFIHICEGRFKLALDSLSNTLKIFPDYLLLLFWQFITLAWNQSCEEAIVVIDKFVSLYPDNFFTNMAVFIKHAVKGEREKCEQVMTSEFQSQLKLDAVLAQVFSSFYALFDEKAKALYWLEAAVDQGYVNYPFLNKYDPFLENIRSEPRFKKLMERVKHEWKNFEV